MDNKRTGYDGWAIIVPKPLIGVIIIPLLEVVVGRDFTLNAIAASSPTTQQNEYYCDWALNEIMSEGTPTQKRNISLQ
jgi:hypothetical protein